MSPLSFTDKVLHKDAQMFHGRLQAFILRDAIVSCRALRTVNS